VALTIVLPFFAYVFVLMKYCCTLLFFAHAVQDTTVPILKSKSVKHYVEPVFEESKICKNYTNSHYFINASLKDTCSLL